MTDKKRESAWLIERYHNSDIEYWNGRGTEKPYGGQQYPWVRGANDALRFARYEDAAIVLSWLLDARGRVAEHVWMGTDPSATTEKTNDTQTTSISLDGEEKT